MDSLDEGTGRLDEQLGVVRKKNINRSSHYLYFL